MNNLYNYCGNFLIDKNHKDVYQNFYASQVYLNSFFGIYAKYNIDKSKTEKAVNGLYLKSIKLKLVNFKGLFNVELPDPKEYPEEKRYVFREEYHIDDDGLPKKSKDIVITLFIKGSVLKKPNTTSTIDPREILFNNGDRIVVERRLLALNGDSPEEAIARVRKPEQEGEKEFAPYIGGVFDEEFYYRNGIYLDQKKETDNNFTDGHIYNPDNDFNLFFGSPSCRKSRLILTINN